MDSETQKWGIRRDIAHYVQQRSTAVLAVVLGSLHHVVEQTTNTVLRPFILDPITDM